MTYNSPVNKEVINKSGEKHSELDQWGFDKKVHSTKYSQKYF